MLRTTLFALVVATACGGGQQAAPGPVIPAEPAAPPADPAPKVEVPAKPAPAEPAPLVFADEPWRAEKPAVGPQRPMQLPTIDRFKLANGIEVYLIERHDLPTLSVDLTFDGGSIDEPASKAGLVQLCMRTAGDGTESLEKIPYEEALADIASSVSVWVGQDQKGVSANTLTKYRDKTLDLWADTILRPGMRQSDFDRNVKQFRIGIEQARKSPGGAAARVSDTILFGPEHVYAHVITEATLDKITLDDCKKFVASYLKPKGARLYVVGDITRADVEKEIGGRLASWKGKPKSPAKVGKAKPRKGRIFFVDTPGASQAQIRVMHLGPDRKARDYFATRLLSAVLGGSFSSRINMNIREAKGWAYGARGSFGYTRDAGHFAASAAIRADATQGSIEEIVKEIRGMIDADVTAEELEREKNSLVLSLPGEFASARQALGQYRSLVYFGLPLDYFATFTDNVAKVTAADIRAASKKHLKLEDAKLLVVGDAKVVLPALEKIREAGLFGKDPIVVLDADGNVKK